MRQLALTALTTTLILGAMSLLTMPACSTVRPEDNGNENEDANGNGTLLPPGSGSTGTTDETQTPEAGGAGGGGTGGGGDMGADPDDNMDLPAPDDPGSGGGCEGVDLTGFWRDRDFDLVFVQAGMTVTSTLLEPRPCDHRDGFGTMSQRVDDLAADVSGCTLTGTIFVCRFGCDDDDSNELCGRSDNGVDGLEFTGQIAPDGNSIDIPHALDPLTGDSVSASYKRLPCEPRTAADYGLTDAVDWQLFDSDQKGPVSFSGEAPDASSAPVNVAAGVEGEVVGVDDQFGDVLVAVIVENGNGIEYLLSETDLQVGDRVSTNTTVGTLVLGEGSTEFALRMDAFDGETGDVISPFCVEE